MRFSRSTRALTSRSRQTDELIARVSMRQHGSEISRGGDPSASVLSRNRGASVRAPRRLGRASLPPRPRGSRRGSTLVNARYRGRQSRVVSRVTRYCFTRESGRVLSVSPSPDSHVVSRLSIYRENFPHGAPRVKRSSAKFRRWQSCTILSWPGEGVKFRPGAP